MKMKSVGFLVAAATLLLGSGTAQAVPLAGFTCITNNNAGDCTIGENQLSGDLTNGVLTITMGGPEYAVVEQVFIEGAGVTGGTFLGGGPGTVIFSDADLGGNLPGGNQPTVNFISAINFGATPPPPKDGIGPHPQDPVFPQTAMFQLDGTFDPFDLRIGVHVIGYESDGSESFVTGGGPKIPEPSAALVFGLGTIVVGTATRRKRR